MVSQQKIKITVKVLILCLCTFSIISSYAQSRKYISQFSHFQSYFNPGLTGFEGSTIRGFVRNQWSGLEGAPRTVFGGVEFDLADFTKAENPDLTGKHAVGLNVLNDRYGAFLDTELILSYASRVRLTEHHNLRLGVGVVYNSIKLDGNNILGEQVNDPVINQYAGSFAEMSVLDFNLGLALTHKNYYLSYGTHYTNRGQISGGEQFMDRRPMVHIVQAGVRENLTENIGLIANFFYRNQSGLPDNIEANIKGLFMQRIWLGTGYRYNYNHNYQAGIVMPRFRFGYVFETPLNRNLMFFGHTHEFMLVFNVFDRAGKESGLNIW